MPLKNKDGTPYRAGVDANPSVPEMDKWPDDQDEVVLHNIGSKPPEPEPKPTIPPTVVVSEAPPPVEPPPSIPFPDPEPEPELEAKKEEPPPEPAPELSGEHLDHEQTVLAWCLPVDHRNGKGPVWGERFRFECVLVDLLPYSLTAWTRSKKVNKGAIIFPSVHVRSGSSLEMYRWWSVSKVVACDDGFLLSSVPSLVAPDFSA